MSASTSVIGYTLHGNRYLNVTNRCTLRCGFCPKFNDTWTVGDHDLRLHQDPDLEQILEAAGDPSAYNEIVFCGFGEPTLRLYTVLEAASRLRSQGGYLRLNTDGLANLVYGRDVIPDLENNVHALSISLNAQDEETYNRHCRPKVAGAYQAMLDFTFRAREYVPDITVTAVDGLPGVDIAACERLADRLGVDFRRRELGVVG